MKNKYNETISYDYDNDKVLFGSIRNQYPLSSEYQEVNYLSCYKNDCIVIPDVYTGLTENIGVIFKFQLQQLVNTILCGGGCHNTTAAPTVQAGGHNYVFCFWHYVNSDVPEFRCWSPSGHVLKELDDTNIVPDTSKVYWVNMYHKSNDCVHCDMREPYPDFIRSLKKHDKQTSLAPNVTCGPLGFFNAPFWSTYYNYYGFPYNNFATATGNNYTMGYHSVGRRIFSNIIIYNPTTMAIRKYLYTCYKKSTHQYGLYDGISHTFYGGVREMNVDNYWTNNDYYWNHIDTATGNTRYAKECTFLNICGPEE